MGYRPGRFDVQRELRKDENNNGEKLTSNCASLSFLRGQYLVEYVSCRLNFSCSVGIITGAQLILWLKVKTVYRLVARARVWSIEKAASFIQGNSIICFVRPIVVAENY